MEEFESAFRAFDIDGSNSLDSDELAAALSSLGISEVVSPAVIERYWARADEGVAAEEL